MLFVARVFYEYSTSHFADIGLNQEKPDYSHPDLRRPPPGISLLLSLSVVENSGRDFLVRTSLMLLVIIY